VMLWLLQVVNLVSYTYLNFKWYFGVTFYGVRLGIYL